MTKNKFLRSVSVCYAVAIATFKEWSVYRTHTLVSVFVGPVYFTVQFFIWTAVFSTRTEIAGMDLESIIRYFAAIALIGYITMDFADWNLSMLIRTGKYLTFALRPVHHRFFAFSQKIGHRILGFTLEFIPCILIFNFIFNVNMIPDNLLWALVSITFAFLINFYFNYILGMISFWFVEVGALRQIIFLLNGFFSGVLIPLSFFPEWLRQIQYFLPFQYTVYVPAMVFTGNFTPQLIIYQAIAVIVIYLVSEIVYRRAMKRFNDVGA